MVNPVQSRLADVNNQALFPREISWLSFNARVLQEARNVDVPLIQRVRYLGIFSNNLDEFFRVRVAEVRRLISVSRGSERQAAKDLLQSIQREVVALQKEFDAIYASLMSELQKQKIYLINERQLDEGQAEFVRHFFRETVLPELEPILLDESLAIPNLADESLYLAVMIKSREGEKFAVLEVPSEQLGRFIEIPRQKGRRKGTVYITLDNVIRACLPQVFRGVFTISSVKAYCFKFSRDAELELDPSINESLIEKMASSLKQRRKADAGDGIEVGWWSYAAGQCAAHQEAGENIRRRPGDRRADVERQKTMPWHHQRPGNQGDHWPHRPHEAPDDDTLASVATKEAFTLVGDHRVAAYRPDGRQAALHQTAQAKTHCVTSYRAQARPEQGLWQRHPGLTCQQGHRKQDSDARNNDAGNGKGFGEGGGKKGQCQPAWMHAQPGRQFVKPGIAHVSMVSPGLNQTESGLRLRASSMA